jgi:hypothetical protein
MEIEAINLWRLLNEVGMKEDLLFSFFSLIDEFDFKVKSTRFLRSGMAKNILPHTKGNTGKSAQ